MSVDGQGLSAARYYKDPMKTLPLLVALATLTPSLVCAQNQQFSDCRTLAMAGNFVGADEAVVDGLVCNVGKPKTSASASAPATAKAAEGSKALLGIIEPEILRSKEKAGANPGSVEATPGPTPGSVPAAGGAPSSSFVTNPKQSLGEVARAFRKDRGLEITAKHEQSDLEREKPGNEEVDPVAVATKTTVTEPLPARTTLVSPEPEPAARTKAGETATAPPAFSSAPRQALRTVKTEVITARPAQSSPTVQESSPGAARDESAIEHETSFPGRGAKSSRAPDVQAPTQEGTPASAERAPTSPPIAASPGSPATADPPEPKPERLPTPGISAPSFPTELQANNIEEDSPFREGQSSNCNKNVSLGSMDKDKLFLAIPDWALKWYEKNQKRFPRICFSDSLMPGAKNYLVVFHMVGPHAPETGKLPSSGDTTSESGMGSFTASYGSTWHYTYERTVTTTILSVSAEMAPHNQPSTSLYATAYSEQGIPVSRYSATSGRQRVKETSYKPGKRPDVELPELRVIEELLSHILEDIAKL